MDLFDEISSSSSLENTKNELAWYVCECLDRSFVRDSPHKMFLSLFIRLFGQWTLFAD